MSGLVAASDWAAKMPGKFYHGVQILEHRRRETFQNIRFLYDFNFENDFHRKLL